MSSTDRAVQIRRVHHDDRAQWLALWQGYLHFYRAEITDAVSEETFFRLTREEQVYGLVAQDRDGRLLGLMNLIFHPSTWSSQGYCYIEDLYVSPSARGQKVSEQLFEQAYRLADRHQCGRVYWMTQEYNAPARSLYDKVGNRSSFVVYNR
ncbi:TPA: GNAT family N-acetyltransferase [Serratia odorifera]|nr:GNAT family N-acetyltransferase [Serratia odorifera]